MSDKAIQVQDLHKDYGEVYAVQGVSFDIKKGEIFSLLGPNGAGKSTTISMISPAYCGRPKGMQWYSETQSSMRRAAVKARLGVVPQEIALYEDLSARENLDFWGKMNGLRGADLAKRRR
jgi:ABC-2 type transport system ATP-binding protein